MMYVLTVSFPLIIQIWLGVFQSIYCSKQCEPYEFFCGTPFNSCLPLSKVCDNHCDCFSCTDESVNCGSKFPLRYPKYKSKNCHHNIIGHTYGVISSPGFPKSYPHESDCSWLVSLGKYVKIEFRKEYLHLNEGDYVVFYDGSSSNAKVLGKFYSNEEMQTPIVSSSGTVFINLKTGLRRALRIYKPYRGFNITYQIRGVCIPGIQRSCVGEAACYDIRYDRCTGVWQCPLQGTDELGCPNCPPSHYFCWFDQSCYSPEQRCDGKPDCKHRRDELNCDPIRCGSHNGTFLCATGGHCIYESWRCDGAIDCSDGSDEVDCPRRPTSLRVILASVVGSLLCALIIVITISYMCKLHALRHVRANASLCEPESPLQAMMEAEFRHRRPPPSYDDAMRASLLQMRYNLAQSLLTQDSATRQHETNSSRISPPGHSHRQPQETRSGGSSSLTTYSDIDPYEDGSSNMASEDAYSIPHNLVHTPLSIPPTVNDDDVPCILTPIVEEEVNYPFVSMETHSRHNDRSYYSLDSDPYDVALINPGFESEEGCDV